MFGEIVQEQSTAHLKPRNLSSKYVQIAGAINSLNSSKQLLPPWKLGHCSDARAAREQHLTPHACALLLGCCQRPRSPGLEMTGGHILRPFRSPPSAPTPTQPIQQLYRPASALEEPRPKIPGSSKKPWGHLAID